ncbi:DUF4381 domain-containing protein [Congregibacter sp.]|uniref:DUF4381 domain-containing protein n=1 Tax=Congregibacter sp. TaxID=2744308 RepID=UPI003F6B4BBD
MEPDAIIKMLEPLREPEAVSWWPPAPGWWVLALLALALIVYGLVRLWRFHQRAAPLRAARQEFLVLEKTPLSDAERAAALGVLQRRLAISVAGRKACAGLTGQAWADFLNSLAKGTEPYFDATLADIAYRPRVSSQDCEGAQQATRRWLQELERPR